LEPAASCSMGTIIEDAEAGRGSETPSSAGHISGSRTLAEGSGRPSPGFPAPLIAVGERSNMISPSAIPGSSTPRSTTAQAINFLMLQSPEEEENWLLHEISNFNVPVKRRRFPKEASIALREALDETVSLVLSLHTSSPLSASTFALFVLFPRLLMRPLPDGCQGSFAAATLSRRCNQLREGEITVLLTEAHEAQTERVAKLTKAASTSASTTTFPKTARADILAGAGAVGRGCKLAFSYGLKTNPGIAAKFLAKLTMGTRHSHIEAHVPKVNPPRICIPLKVVADAFSGMPRKSATHRDGWAWELLTDATQTPSTT